MLSGTSLSKFDAGGKSREHQMQIGRKFVCVLESTFLEMCIKLPYMSGDPRQRILKIILRKFTSASD
jgi:hypothetical protein